VLSLQTEEKPYSSNPLLAYTRQKPNEKRTGSHSNGIGLLTPVSTPSKIRKIDTGFEDVFTRPSMSLELLFGFTFI
jgi:hypothetical protein